MTHVGKLHAERLICMEVRQGTRTVFPEAGGKGWRRNSGHMAVRWRGDITLDGSTSPHRSLLTGLRAAAGIGAARAADIAAATVRAALTPADPHQHEEQEDPQDHQADKHPLWKDAQRNLLEVAPLQDTAYMDGCLSAKEVSGKDLGKKGHLTRT